MRHANDLTDGRCGAGKDESKDSASVVGKSGHGTVSATGRTGLGGRAAAGDSNPDGDVLSRDSDGNCTCTDISPPSVDKLNSLAYVESGVTAPPEVSMMLPVADMSSESK